MLRPVATTGSSMRISEAAAASGCHLETIRYYERLGLLPQANRLTNGYRDYGDGDVDRLRFIVRGRDLGFSLEEIRRLLALSASSELSCTEVDRLARQQLAAVNERISELRRMARELKRTIDSCARQSCGECSILGALQQRIARRRTTRLAARA
jgi:MerR family mercuric resistance operon transcriptional regulator